MYGILYELTPITDYGVPLVNSQTKVIDKKRFKLYEQAQDFLKEKKYSSGTDFYSKEIIINGQNFYSVAIILIIK